jgi:uncharacterized protein (DUF433 family)
MATAAKSDAYPHIEKTAGVRGGKARIAATRIAVKDIAYLYEQGVPDKQMLTYFSERPLTVAEVHAAIALRRSPRRDNGRAGAGSAP